MKGILSIQSQVPDNVLTRLNDLGKKQINNPEWKDYLPQTPQLKCSHILSPRYGDTTKFVVDSDGFPTMPDGLAHNDALGSSRVTDNEIIIAVALAFQSVYQDIERILNKDLKNSSHDISTLMRIYKASDVAQSALWHRDGLRGTYETPVSSLVYFLHEGCHALLSIRQFKELDAFTTVETKSGMSITFADSILHHQVHDIRAVSGKTANRGLLTFFYMGPSGLPPQVDALHGSYQQFNIQAEIEERNEDGTAKKTVHIVETDSVKIDPNKKRNSCRIS